MFFPEGDIHRAFEEEELFPSFQPLVELRTGQVAGFEVLARWNHGKLGAIPPDDFIPVVEQSGLINRLTKTMMQKAFDASQLLPPTATLAFNLSPVQLLDPTLPAKLEAVAAKGGFSLHRVAFEITESALVDDLSRAQSVAGDLKALGCRLALDDFGTGYSSLKHLQALPFDELKVDRSFVNSMMQARESRKIVAAVVGLGHSLGVQTVAEGVETEEQASMLLWLGCDLGQGWFYGRPSPASDIPRMIVAASQTRSPVLPEPVDANTIMGLEALPAQRLAQLQAIYDGAPVGLCFLDRKMRYVSLNRHLAEMNGSPIASHIGKTPAELVPAIFPLIEPFIRRALKGEAVTGVEIPKPEMSTGDNDRTLLASYRPVRDEAGEVLGVSVAIVDITQRKRVEEALRVGEEHYRHMVELNPHTPWVLDGEGKVIDASSRWQKTTGMAMPEAMGDGWMRALHPDDVEHTIQAIQNTLRTGQPIDIEYRVTGTDGSWKWMWSRGSAVTGPSGEVLRVYGTVEEIEQPKLVRLTLERCRAELQATFDAVPVGMILADAPEGNVAMANHEAHRIFREAIQPGQKIADYGSWAVLRADDEPLKPDDYPLASAILHGETTSGQMVHCILEDGRRATVALSASPVYGRNGEVVAGVMVIEEMDNHREKS
jgi:PAS domain S-box-containing protein